MNNAFKVVSILVAITLLTSFSQLQAQSKPTKPAVPKEAKKAVKKRPSVTDSKTRAVAAVEVLQARAYTYIKVDDDGELYWVATTKTQMAIGDKFAFRGGAKMPNFTSKDLQRTFEEVYFLGGIRRLDADGNPIVVEEVIVPAGDTLPDVAIHDVETLEVEQANSYTYVKAKEGQAVYWIAINKREIEVGRKFSFGYAIEMLKFRSTDLQRTFARIYFIGGTSMDEEDEKAAAAEAAVEEETSADDDTPIAVEGGVSIADVYAKKGEYAGKTIRVGGKVVKFSRGIMGMNWVHIQDGTGGEKTNDLTITTDETVTVGRIVTFDGTIVLDKDFGGGYFYEVIMQEGKQVK